MFSSGSHIRIVSQKDVYCTSNFYDKRMTLLIYEPLEMLCVEAVCGNGKCRAFMFVFSGHFAVFLIEPACVAQIPPRVSLFSHNTETRF